MKYKIATQERHCLTGVITENALYFNDETSLQLFLLVAKLHREWQSADSIRLIEHTNLHIAFKSALRYTNCIVKEITQERALPNNSVVLFSYDLINKKTIHLDQQFFDFLIKRIFEKEKNVA